MKTTLPAGNYYIGDPCYVIEGDGGWDDFCSQFGESDGYGGVFTFRNHDVCAFQTQWGDGCYPCTDGAMLGVDAGIIGAIPLEIITGGDIDAGTVIEFDTAFACHRDSGGLMHFGDVEVNTGDDDQDEEDEVE